MASDQDSTRTLLLVTAIASGSAFHQLVKRVEFDRHPKSIVGFVFGSIIPLSLILWNVYPRCGSFWSALKMSWLLVSCAVVSLWTNMLLYRAFFHPLNNFPGPFGAKLTKFWGFRKVFESKIRYFKVAGKLQERYGDYVRAGPRELIVFDPKAINPILGFGSKTPQKGPFYGGPLESLHTTRDPAFHKKRRKVWDMAFKHTLSDYGPYIEEFTDTLLARVERNVNKPITINELCIHYSYDVMSSLAFGASAKFLEGESSEFANKVLSEIQFGIRVVGFLIHIPWVLTILEPIETGYNIWSREQVENRKKMKNPRRDIMGHLLEHTDDTPSGRTVIEQESRVIIGAGSDTAAFALSAIFVLLTVHPTYQQKLREEGDVSFDDKTYTCAKPQPLLDAIISEALRLYPPVTFFTQRVTPAAGITIGDVHIPPDTVLSVATYQLQRDPRNFVKPNDFIPERWTSQPELVLNKEAFLPFSVGPYNCVGRSLAWMELRSVISRTVHNYEVSLPKGVAFDEENYFDGIEDHFTAGLPKCDLVFSKRVY